MSPDAIADVALLTVSSWQRTPRTKTAQEVAASLWDERDEETGRLRDLEPHEQTFLTAVHVPFHHGQPERWQLGFRDHLHTLGQLQAEAQGYVSPAWFRCSRAARQILGLHQPLQDHRVRRC